MAMRVAPHLPECKIETEGPYAGYCHVCSVLEEIYSKLSKKGYQPPEDIG